MVDEQALGESLVAIERLLGEAVAITREGMQEQFAARVKGAGDRWLDAVSHLMAAQDHVRIAGIFMGVEAMPAPIRTTTPTPAAAVNYPHPAAITSKPAGSRRPLSRRRPR